MTFLLIISSITVLTDTPDSLVLRYTINFKQSTINSRVSYEIEGGTYPDLDGMPALPYIRKKILTPVGGRVDVRYYIESTERVKNIPVVVQFYGRKSEREIPEVFQSLPAELQHNRPSPYGNATLLIYPFTFDGEYINIRKSIVIKIYFRGGEWIRPEGYPERNPSLFLNQIRGKSLKIKGVGKAAPKAGLWIKLKTTRDGLYEITPDDLREVVPNPGSIDPNNVEIRHGYKGIFKWDMDSLINLDSLPLIIPAIYETDDDGSFEENERIIFFAHSLWGWSRNRFTDRKYFYYNPYSDTNAYWLSLDGNPFVIEEENLSGGEDISYFNDTIHLEEDNYSPLRSGIAWGWEELNTTGGTSSGSILNVTFTAHSPYDNEAILRIAFYPKSGGQYAFRISLNGTEKFDTVTATGNPAQDRTILTNAINDLREGSNDLEITLLTQDESVIMDYVEVIYRRMTAAESGNLTINSDTNTIKHYNVNNLSRDPYLINCTNTENPYLISHEYSAGSIEFSADARRILIQETPYSIEGISIKDPTSLQSGGADWIAITPPEIAEAAYRLKRWRENHIRGFPSPITKVININEIYDNFSFGVRDPSAIKRFLYHAYNYWNPPVSYVFLFGNGSYDNKNLTDLGKSSFIPIHTEGIWIHTGSGYLDKNPCWDSWFVDFNEDRIQDIPIGRVTASNLNEATNWVDKLIEYESSNGIWRTKAILLADDAYSPNYSPGEATHTNGAESISDRLPNWIYQKKIYLMEYPRVGGEKPEAEDAHISAMSEGALVAVYLGHGNLRRLTHESVFLIQDVSKFKNWRKIPIYYFGSCDVGYFERPNEDCIAGYSNLYLDGGTMVSIAAGRATYPGNNNALGRSIIGHLFTDSVNTSGDAYLLAKGETGHFSYTFFGDPATSILIDSTKLTCEIPDTASGGERFTIKGETQTASELIFCTVTEANYDTTLNSREGGGGGTVGVNKTGRTLFKGYTPVTNDSFQIKINLPVDLNEELGNIYLYCRGDKESYIHSNIQFIPGTGISDTIPPEVGFQIKGKNLSERDIIPPSGEMTIIIRDSSGIDMRSRINLQVRINNYAPIYLVDNFTYHSGSPTTGEATFPYEEPLFSDTIRFTVHVKDNAGIIATREATFRIGDEKLLWGVENYPNPMKERTTIIYYLGREVNVEIKIYTIAGRTVKNLYTEISRYGVNYAQWDGKDEKGRKVSNGIYYYMVKPEDGEPYYGKIAVIR